eukprot:TRINITY_DN11949_c0_g1_i5.p3 TRINITY_DN11949_c0_g1~~TRINITY_DN11949_c0_g1_i5.p3  ORF type:complete len:223 (+),score=-2.09 TRINITY_DN11949_c0_g1_i5:131-799(+)
MFWSDNENIGKKSEGIYRFYGVSNMRAFDNWNHVGKKQDPQDSVNPGFTVLVFSFLNLNDTQQQTAFLRKFEFRLPRYFSFVEYLSQYQQVEIREKVVFSSETSYKFILKKLVPNKLSLLRYLQQCNSLTPCICARKPDQIVDYEIVLFIRVQNQKLLFTGLFLRSPTKYKWVPSQFWVFSSLYLGLFKIRGYQNLILHQLEFPCLYTGKPVRVEYVLQMMG